ncbi:hypothetical protein [Micromonospora zhanjiangensis]|uniref:Transposase of IS4/5 family n=1 Tax=Micromonospora zhanjiangensis TaxID=1522057 RepID=A0ABV8KL03_9ACTN
MPLAPRHRRNWARWGRWCVCGFRWKTCPDRLAAVPTEPRDYRPAWANRPAWPTNRSPERNQAAVWRRDGERQ